ncbi:hypothetical protein FDP41_010048 [Naegleria fowleri]|uniref:Uncharacterized protein n=1 Tax=Naegleria fowleri TaxID=5763 RepID=A0A6A5BCG4_NAEFO|nr:uncharacterized protein FDP41_010048 [Naegleria fowleri]KAF0971825.1 hypothetical protein FDP41_010048 [Naegleria fowleri]
MVRSRGGRYSLTWRPRIYEHPNNFQKFNRWIERNDQSKHFDLLSRYVPYSYCSRLARLWILKDIKNTTDPEKPIKHIQSDPNGQNATEWPEEGSQKLRELPMDAKAYIICFVSTKSMVTKSYNIYSSILDPKQLEVIDPWWLSYFKHRIICQDVKQVLENIIATRISSEGLDLSDFVTFNKHFMILSLIGAHQELMTLGSIEKGFISYESVASALKEADTTAIEYASSFQSDEEYEEEYEESSENKLNEDELMFDILQCENREFEKEFVTLTTHFEIGTVEKPILRKHENRIHANITKMLSIFRNTIDLYRNVYSPNYFGDVFQRHHHRENHFIHTLIVPLTGHNIQFVEILLQDLKGLKNLTLLVYYPRSIHTIFAQLWEQKCRLPNIETLKIVNLNRGYISHDGLEKMLLVCERLRKLYIEGFDTSRFTILKQPERAFELHIDNINASSLERMMQTYANIEPCQVDGSSLLRAIFIESERSLLEKKDMLHVVLKRHSLEHFNWALNNDIQTNSTYLPLVQYALYLNNRYSNCSFGKLCPSDFALSCIQYGHDIMNNIFDTIPLLPSELAEQVINIFLKERLMTGQLILTVEKFRELLLNILGNLMIGTFLPAFSSLRGFVKDIDQLFKNFEVKKYHRIQQFNLFHHLLFLQMPTFVVDYLMDYILPEDLLEITSVPVLLLAMTSTSISDECIVKMIKKQPLILNQKAKGSNLTALHLACSDCKRWNLIPLLVNEYHEDINAKDANGNTPYDYARSQCDGFETVIPACLKAEQPIQ